MSPHRALEMRCAGWHNERIRSRGLSRPGWREYVLSVGGVRRDGSGGVFVGHVCGGESGNEGECGSLVVGPSSVVRGGAASKSVRNRHS